ncbi:4-hydroxybenzoate octaprenyltransferase [Stenotrophobium rhamnosiphilum]|uniref:4-hydroxybenzoate octaprenyltransferase n=1 Tax=Stenotrophobium rhamnosiphilum TaxID=2029166 RepID=A0A2T5MGJ7_9GAMM|nr:4-hydroxybenzoate octaprenyltransferase [Stenotrophobium rhamnosiphilum]PTU31705.1 4-hydroxybenzoate octaprenyltransferase [Stenotrophobium rhamnosiphilum]
MTYREKLNDYWQLTRMHRPIGIFLLLWPTLWALWIAAGGFPSPHVLLVFVLGTVLMRSAGCAINDFADRDFDPHVARTKDRPVASGRVTPEEAVRLFVVLSLIAFGLLTSLKDVPTILLGIPAAILAGSYPFMKRWISIPQAYLGLAFSAGIPMAFSAIQHQVPWAIVLPLVIANVCWVVAYDTLYAMVDREDDLKIGVKSSAILFGRHDRLIVALLHATSLLLLIQLGLNAELGTIYFAGIAVAAWLAAYQQWITRDRDPQACFRAFLNNNYFGAAIFIGLLLDLSF